jgi:hypothetical protein
MSVLLSAHNLRNDDDAEFVNISNGEWCAILALAQAFGIDTSPPANHDPICYTPEVLNQIADRIDQIKDAPEWLRWLAQNGGAHLS